MKNSILTLLFIGISGILFAQAPQKFNYQAVARDAAGDALLNQPIGLRISILEGSGTGTILYRETHGVTTNQFGLFTLAVGTGTVVNGTFSGINWGLGDKYLKVEMDPNGGTTYTNMGANQLLSVPYALNAGNASSNWTLTGNDLFNNNSGNVGIGSNAPSSKLEIAHHSDQINTQLNLQETTADDYSRLKFSNSNSNKSWTIAATNSDANGNDQLNIFHSVTGDIFSIGQNGTVGIGIQPASYSSTRFGVQGNNLVTGGFENTIDTGGFAITAVNYAFNGAGISSVATGEFASGLSTRADSASSRALVANSTKGTGANITSVSGLPLLIQKFNPGTSAKFIGGNVLISSNINDVPSELLDVKGAIRLGNTTNNNSGAIRYTGSDFEGNISGTWTSLTAGGGGPSLWNQNGDSIRTTNPNAKIALGTNAGVDDIYVYRNSAGVRLQATDVAGNSRVTLMNAGLLPFQITKKGNFMFQSFLGRMTYNAGIIDNNQGNLFVHTGDTMLFGNNYVLHSAFAPNGNLGIGTLAPSAKLEVAGQVKITGGSPGAGKVLTSNAAGLATWQTPASYTAGTGIGIAANVITNTAPDQVITLLGSGATQVTGTYPNFTITSADNNTTYTAGTGLSLAGTVFSAQNSSALWNANQLQGRSVASTLPANGDVLTYNGTNWAPAAGSGGGSGPWTTIGNDIYNNNSNAVLVGTTAPANGGIFEATKNNAFGTVASIYNSGAAYMTILKVTENGTSGNPAGCVGCGGSAAIKTSSVYGDALFASSSNGRGIYLSGGSGFYPAMQIETNPGAIAALEACGDVNVVGNIKASGTITASQAISCSSDERLKKQIEPLKDALEKVLAIRGVTYEWRTEEFPGKNFTNDEQIGFIAQELEKVFPQVVYTDKDGFKSVDYSRLTPILVEALKDQQSQINKLVEANTSLSNSFNRLEAKVDALILKSENGTEANLKK